MKIRGRHRADVMSGRAAIPTLLLLFLAGSRPPAQTPIQYQLQYQDPARKIVHVTLTVPEALDGPRPLVIPRAIPSGYGEAPYDEFVDNVRAASPNGDAVDVVRGEGPRWTLGKAGARMTRVEYDVDIGAMEQAITSAADTSKARDRYLGLLGYSVFGYLEGVEADPIALTINGPPDWPVLTTLAPEAPPAVGHVAARATDFYALADSQVVMGPAVQVQRVDGRVPLYVAAYAEGPMDLEVETRTAREALDRTVAYFDSAPFPHYTVHRELLTPVSPRHAYGFSMEHLESGTFYFAADAGLTQSSPESARDRVRFNLLHHMAHSWIPKRSYGEGYLPFNWELAPLIDTVWVNEGFARFAAIDMTADAMKGDASAAYRKRVLDNLRRILNEMPPFIRRMSLVELSRVASTRYSSDFRTGQSSFARGALIAAEMDDRIREQSGGRKRFRDGLRGMVEWTRKNQRAFRIDEISAIIGEATGVSVKDIQDRWLNANAR
jgi:predicted metalloprotease with PDZ domain